MSSSENRPYLDQLNMRSHHGTGKEDWKQLVMQPIVVPSLAHTGIRSVLTNEAVVGPELEEATHKYMLGDPVSGNYIRAFVAKKEPASRARGRAKKKLAPIDKTKAEEKMASMKNFQELLNAAYGH